MTIINEAYIYDEFGFKTDSQLKAEYRFNSIFGDMEQSSKLRLKNILSSIETVVTRL